MLPARLQAIALTLAAGMLFALAPAASAQDYPRKPVHVIVPFAPGGGSDFIARFMAQRLSESLGKPFVVDNKPGAGGNLGIEQGVRAAADGYTLTLGTTEEVDQEVKQRIAVAGKGGGYIISSANSIIDYCKIDNVWAMSKALKKYGKY